MPVECHGNQHKSYCQWVSNKVATFPGILEGVMKVKNITMNKIVRGQKHELKKKALQQGKAIKASQNGGSIYYKKYKKYKLKYLDLKKYYLYP